MAYDDLRDWIKTLEKRGELKRIREEVSPELEITEITGRVSKSGARGAGQGSSTLAKFAPGGTALGCTGEITVSKDHLIVAQRVAQNATESGKRAPACNPKAIHLTEYLYLNAPLRQK